MPVLVRHFWLLTLGCVVTLAGCQNKEAGSPAGKPAPPRVAPPADEVTKSPPVETVKFTDRQVAALDSIVAAGGSFEKDAEGHILAIDLASSRAVADEELAQAVLNFPTLHRLQLTVSNVTLDTLAGLATLSELEELLLQDAAVDDATLAKILRGTLILRRLTLRRANQITDAGLAVLPECRLLEVLALIEMSGISGEAFPPLQRVERLRSLDVRNCGRLTAADFGQLVRLSALAELKVGGPAVNDQVLGLLVKHPALTSLSVDDAQISSACLQPLASTPEFAQRLRSLSFARCAGVTDETLQTLGAFPALETLALREIMLSGAFLQYVLDAAAEPLDLKTLIITNAFLTDETLTPLPGLCPGLTRLDLSGNPRVTNAALDILRQIRPLREVRLEETGVTEKWFPQVE